MSRTAALLIVGFAVTASAVAVRVATSGGSVSPESGDGPGNAATGLAGAGPEAGETPRRPPRIVARALGKVESASEKIGVASDITGRIVGILVEEGDPVTPGQPLVQLDDTLQRAAVAAAEAAVRVARARKAKLEAGARVEEIRGAEAVLAEAEARARIARERAERGRRLEASGASSTEESDSLLRESEAREAQVRAAREELAILRNYARPEDLEVAAAELEVAERELEARKAELQKTTLRSPIAGTVVERHRRVGEAVSSFQVEPVVTVADLRHLRVRAEVDEIDIANVRLDQRVLVHSESFPELELHGRTMRLGRTMGRRSIESSDPNAREDVRVREVVIDLDQAPALPLDLRVIAAFLEE